MTNELDKNPSKLEINFISVGTVTSGRFSGQHRFENVFFAVESCRE